MSTIKCKEEGCELELEVEDDNIFFMRAHTGRSDREESVVQQSDSGEHQELGPGSGKKLALTCPDDHTNWYWVKEAR